MREIVIISGKGGTGKTSISASFAAISGQSLLVDCDVDGADLHLVLEPAVQESHSFYGLPLPKIDPETCRRCGACQRVCRCDAIEKRPGGYWIDPLACERCGACVDLCPRNSIHMEESISGEWYRSETRLGPMLHARLEPGAENSGKLVTQIRQEARKVAEARAIQTILVDGPPGIGCPVIAVLSGASAAFIVTEPTVSGLHDLRRITEVAARFRVQAMILINKADLNEAFTKQVEEYARQDGLALLGRVPYDHAFVEAQLAGQTLPEHTEGPASDAIRAAWHRLETLLPADQ